MCGWRWVYVCVSVCVIGDVGECVCSEGWYLNG